MSPAQEQIGAAVFADGEAAKALQPGVRPLDLPALAQPSFMTVVPGNLGGSKWTSGVIKLIPKNRGDQYTIRVKTTGNAFVFTNHQMVAK